MEQSILQRQLVRGVWSESGCGDPIISFLLLDPHRKLPSVHENCSEDNFIGFEQFLAFCFCVAQCQHPNRIICLWILTDISSVVGLAWPNTGEGEKRIDPVSDLHGTHSVGTDRTERPLNPRSNPVFVGSFGVGGEAELCNCLLLIPFVFMVSMDVRSKWKRSKSHSNQILGIMRGGGSKLQPKYFLSIIRDRLMEVFGSWNISLHTLGRQLNVREGVASYEDCGKSSAVFHWVVPFRRFIWFHSWHFENSSYRVAVRSLLFVPANSCDCPSIFCSEAEQGSCNASGVTSGIRSQDRFFPLSGYWSIGRNWRERVSYLCRDDKFCCFWHSHVCTRSKRTCLTPVGHAIAEKDERNSFPREIGVKPTMEWCNWLGEWICLQL